MTHAPGAYDALVVGVGHNGLVSAAYLARAGRRTVVRERRTTTGGAATTEQPWPDLPGVSLTRLINLRRPASGYADHRTPVSGLYNASSATHAGGGVCGIPGMQAAKAVLADARSARRSPRRLLGRPAR